MGIQHIDGYSASVEAFVEVYGCQVKIAKTNGVTFSLAEPSNISAKPKTEADLTIVVDGMADSKKIILRDGLSVGQRVVEYDDLPF